jgi:hypothetical protein
MTHRWRKADSNSWSHFRANTGADWHMQATMIQDIEFALDAPLEGSGFELPVPRCALIANCAALVAPPDSAVRGGSLNGRLTTPIGGGPATARLTRREDRSAQLGRGPKTLVIGRQRTNYRFLNGSAASAVCPDRSSRVTKASTAFPICRTYGLGSEIDFVAPSVDDRVTIEVIDELDDALLQLVF